MYWVVVGVCNLWWAVEPSRKQGKGENRIPLLEEIDLDIREKTPLQMNPLSQYIYIYTYKTKPSQISISPDQDLSTARLVAIVMPLSPYLPACFQASPLPHQNTQITIFHPCRSTSLIPHLKLQIYSAAGKDPPGRHTPQKKNLGSDWIECCAKNLRKGGKGFFDQLFF